MIAIEAQDGVDGYAKKADTYFQEMLMVANKVDCLPREVAASDREEARREAGTLVFSRHK